MLVQELDGLAEKIFVHHSSKKSEVVDAWKKISSDENFLAQIKKLKYSGMFPTWEGELSSQVKIDAKIPEYDLLAVDGSQIYPDRHMADVGCFLINIGACLLSYSQKSKVEFFSIPKVFLSDQWNEEMHDLPFSPDIVDLKREEMEFLFALEKSLEIMKNREIPFLCLMDGSLIFWHLESKPENVRDYFLKRYTHILQKFYEHQVPVVSYLSLPKNRELINLVKLELCENKDPDSLPCRNRTVTCRCEAVQHYADWQLAEAFLKPGHRSILFSSHGKIIDYYPQHLEPRCFYMHAGKEIVRVEMPAWVAYDENMLNGIASMCLNQSEKGFGYPVALAEAHEQAVVKGPDREFFYHVIRKIGMVHRQPVLSSQKILKKRGIGI